MALTKVIGNGLGTLGDGTANDTKIVFDGNAQDYHIGLDDSADTLVIGKGTALGTTTSMSFDENGIILKPLQPAFLVTMSSNSAQFGPSGTTPNFDTEIFDQNGDFASNAFTAPVTGRYYLSCLLYGYTLDQDASYYFILIQTSNRNYYKYLGGGQWDSDAIYYGIDVQMLCDMDANDTASISFGQNGGHSSSQILASASFFSGHLVC